MKSHLRSSRLLVAIALLSCSQVFGAEFGQRLGNLSTRAQVGPGGNTATVGFVIGPGGPKNVLIRAVGPTLSGAPYSVPGANTDPKITLFNSADVQILTNDNWGTPQAPSTTSAATLSSAFLSAGAFALPSTTSRDAAILATNLAPGKYTAQVTNGSASTATGVALVEIYDVTGSARLINLSTLAQVGTGSGIIISGLIIPPGGGARKILIRAAGPQLGLPTTASPAGFGVPGALSNPAIAVYDANNIQIAANDDWNSENSAALSASFAAAGAFPFANGSKDAALLVDLQPNANYTVQVSGFGGATGLALIEVYDLTLDNAATVGVTATVASTDTKGAPPGVFTFTRTGSTAAPLTVYYRASGSATPGVDIADLPGVVTIPAGATSATVNVSAQSSGASATINKDATVTLLSGPGYSLGSNTVAAVAIFYNPGTLYIASLRAPGSATASTAYGTATVQLSSDNTFALVSLAFSNLSSPQTAVYLRLGNPGEVGTEVLRLPAGQVSGSTWVFADGSSYKAADLVTALKSGRIFVDLETAQFPSGELLGTFIQSSGSLVFAAPAAAPALPDTPMTAAEAARFLTQATFGPTKAEIDALTGAKKADLNAWITAQLALPASLHLPAVDSDFTTYTAVGENPQYSQQNRQAAWWKLALTAPDQLRQRVAFALSEIFVVSDVNGTLFNNARGMANYYDILVRGAAGNFRQVLEEVTLSPIMGVYLSSLRNAKATFDSRGALLTSPDENYAREIMQLFTIGLNQLQPDGTLKLDPTGLPIPTYDNTTITQMARVFTGLGFTGDTTVAANFRGAATNYIAPMVFYPAFHEDGAKTIFNKIPIAPNQGGAADLKQTLDALFNHANTGPFIARQLIQRLVTSNPGPGYVYRVAQAFADNGSGVRGDLGAVVRAILTDYEARSSAVAATASFGKLREPLLRATAILRGYGAAANVGRFAIFNPEANLAQAALRATTVFNFFEPNFVMPGLLASSGLYAPEYQILTDTTAISIPNQLWNYIYANRSGAFGGAATANPAETTVGFSWSNATLLLARTPQALVDQFNLVLTGGALPKAITDRIVAAVAAMPTSTATNPTTSDLERVRSAFYLTVSIPQGAIQK